MKHERSCLCCKFFYLSLGSEGYSEYTPSGPAYIDCEKGHIKVHNYDEGELDRAKDCKNFIHR